MAELGTHPATERAGMVTLRLQARAFQIYPDIRTYGSTGRGRKRAYGDDYTGTNPETADTAKSEPTGYCAAPRPYQRLVLRHAEPT